MLPKCTISIIVLHLIYPYRNRDIERIKKSLDSLKAQTNQSFKVWFVDYGSELVHANEVEELVVTYNFATYCYHYTQHQPWNKSKALNAVIKHFDKGYCFVADIDMIFSENFIEIALNLQKPNAAIYFKVGFLDEAETKQNKDFKDYNISFESTTEATGLTMFPVKPLRKLRGFDEFYHFWGSEDTDVHVRLKNAGYEVQFYDTEILMLHQWHKSYRSKEKNELTKSLQLSDVVRLNYRHLKEAIRTKRAVVNLNSWGNPMTQSQFNDLENTQVNTVSVLNTKDRIQHLLFYELQNLSIGIHKYKFYSDLKESTFKYKLKKKLGKDKQIYLSMKTVNDMLLLHLISFYRDSPFTIKVDTEAQTIHLTISL